MNRRYIYALETFFRADFSLSLSLLTSCSSSHSLHLPHTHSLLLHLHRTSRLPITHNPTAPHRRPQTRRPCTTPALLCQALSNPPPLHRATNPKVAPSSLLLPSLKSHALHWTLLSLCAGSLPSCHRSPTPFFPPG